MNSTRMMVVAGVAGLGLMLGGCSAEQWSRVGDRLIDGMTMNVGMDAGGEMQLGLGFSSERADTRAQERELAVLKRQLMQSALGESAQSMALGQDDALRSMIREVLVAEMLGGQGGGTIDLASSR